MEQNILDKLPAALTERLIVPDDTAVTPADDAEVLRLSDELIDANIDLYVELSQC